MKPLAYRLRPKNFLDIVGQDHLIGEQGVIKKMIDNNKLCSLILYGAPGCGKTSIASIISSYYGLNTYSFNASVDSKAKLKEISDGAKYYENCIVVIDEIHRMKKDTQDFLLPFVEDGSIIIIGLTTENPYATINPAIRSRCHIYRLNEIKKDDIILLLKKTINENEEFKNKIITDDILEYIALTSSCEIRTALNMLEVTALLEEVSLENVKNLIGLKSFALDSQGENYYDLLSAFIKSVRGSDPDAALHYLARLLKIGDLQIICRRLMCLMYEDIGLGNPQLGPRVYAACKAALELGLPEANLPLANITVDLALSPKSNSTYTAINEALADLDYLESMQIPKHILNKELKSHKVIYKYPHDFDDSFVVQQYMPDELLSKEYYKPVLTGNYERAFNDRLNVLKQRKLKK